MRLIMIVFVISTILLSLFISLKNENLVAFTSDGCSAFPDGTFAQNELWLQCCTEHDFTYWQGGTYEQRLNADLELKHCVADVGEPHIANLMLAGVRVGGSPYFPTLFRWGYGWSYPRFYKEITKNEQKQIDILIKQIPEVFKLQKNK